MTLKEQLQKINACEDAVNWVGDKTLEQAWGECPRGDWMLWLSIRSKNYDLKTLTLAKAHCANTVRKLMDKRSTDAVDVAIKFGEGNATREELDAAADAAAHADADAAAHAAAHAAYAAAHAAAHADADAAAHAAYAAAHAAHADADAAAHAAYAAAHADADAAAHAAYAAAHAAAAAARKKNQQATADICCKYLPIPIL